MATSSVAGAKSEGRSVPAPAASSHPRLLHYVLPYWWPLLASVTLMAMVGLLDAGRVLFIGPIFDRVLNPGSQGRTMQLFRLPGTGRSLDLQQLMPRTFKIPGPWWPSR